MRPRARPRVSGQNPTTSPLRRRLVVAVSAALVIAACGATDPSVENTASAPAPAAERPVPLPPPPPAAPPAPSEPMQPVMQRFLRTLPPSAWNSTLAASNASFQRFASQRHTEVGQTVRISEAFELQRIGLQFELATVALPGFRDYPDGTNWSILSQYVQILEPTDELQISLSLILYRSADSDRVPTIRRMTSGFGGVPTRERDAIRISDVEIVSDQRLTGRVTTRQDAISSLDLTEPVLLEPGYYIVAFRIDHEPGDVDLLDFRILGTESGEETDERPPPEGPCVYEPTTDPYPEGAFFWRDGEHFIPAFAKVGACTNRFDAVGNPIEVMNPGDIGLDLYGVGAD